MGKGETQKSDQAGGITIYRLDTWTVYGIGLIDLHMSHPHFLSIPGNPGIN